MASVASFACMTVALAAAAAAMNLANVPCGRRPAAAGALTRVKGGREAYRGQFPWVVSVQYHGAHFCMGAVVSERWVLTAAHCLGGRPAEQFTVAVGGHNLTAAAEPGRRRVAVAELVVHADYRSGSFRHDVALLRLADPLAWTDHVQPVCVPAPGAAKFTGRTATMAGWGYLGEWRRGARRPDTLHWVELPVLSPLTCQQWYDDAGKHLKIGPGRLCAGYRDGGKDSCQADSGGPLVVATDGRFQVVGVVSAGFGCGRPGLPGIYTDVVEYSKWIVAAISERATF